MKCSIICLTILSLLTFNTAFAQNSSTEEASKFSSENEAGAVLTSGNSESESYSLKSQNSYKMDDNAYSFFGRYIRAKANGTESSRAWEAGIKYERSFGESFGAFLGHKTESDIYAGFTQRDSTDLGGRYTIIKSESLNWLSELGYRYTTTLPETGDRKNANFARLYTEVSNAFTKTSQVKLWVEYLPNFTESKSYLANAELSLSVIMSDVFSIKMAYLAQYQNTPAVSGSKYLNTTYTTSLVAKF